LLLVLGGGLIALAVAAVARARAKPRAAAAVVRAYETYLDLPDSAWASRSRRVDYTDVLSLNISGYGPTATLLIGTRDRLLSYSRLSFVEADGIEQLAAEIRRQLERQPGGAQLIARMNLRDAIGQAAWAARPVATFALLVSLGIGALLTSQADPGAPFPLTTYGANAPLLVRDGQWFRLFAANFLHADLLHLYMNGLGLLTLGAVLERLLGPWRFTLIYLISALGGSLASALAARAPYSVGASTAIFGLLGALAVLEWRFRTELPGGFRQTPRWWLMVLGINAALPLLVPIIDGFAHAGGFVAGALAALALCAQPNAIRRARPAPWSVRLSTLIGVGVFAIALGAAFAHAQTDAGRDQEVLARAIVNSGSADATTLNAIAWQYAIAKSPSATELELADRAATSAVAMAPGNPEIMDTLATVEYRRGELERAIALERRALAARNDDIAFSQVARFLAARQARRGILAIGVDAGADEVSVERQPTDDGTDDSPELRLHAAAGLPQGAEIWVLVLTRGSLQGAVRLRLGAAAEGGDFRVVPKGNAADLAGDELTLRVALVDATSCQGCPAGALEAEYRPIDPIVSALPGSEVSIR
jgi:rhomboid protease GluP